jgi:predicted nucleotidyltransferase
MNTDNNMFPTPYDDVNLVLQTFLDNARAVLGDYFIGMYLFGSLALGGFNANRSDIDFLVVTSEKLPKSITSDLKIMHKRLYESGLEWAEKLQGGYIPIDALRVYSPTDPPCPLVDKDEFLVVRPESNWVINRHILYTSGVVITGPPLQTIIDPVQPKQLREAVLTLLRNNWNRLVDKYDFFLDKGYQPASVLSMCCFLYIMEHGTVASKQLSVEWVIANSDKKWTKLIKQAMAWHYGDPPGDIGQTQEFIRYSIQKASSPSH